MSFWIAAKGLPTATHYYDFFAHFTACADARMQINICADTRYCLYVNEYAVCEGPCQGPFDLRYYETADLTPYLKAGENTIRVRVLHVVGDEFISVFHKELPALWINGEITEGENVRSFGTDACWECVRIDSILPVRQGFKSLAPMEEHLFPFSTTKMEVISLVMLRMMLSSSRLEVRTSSR